MFNYNSKLFVMKVSGNWHTLCILHMEFLQRGNPIEGMTMTLRNPGHMAEASLEIELGTKQTAFATVLVCWFCHIFGNGWDR